MKKKTKRKTSKQLKKKTKKLLKKIGRRNRKFLKLACCKCDKTFKIRVNNSEIYTKEVKATWVCLACGGY